MDQQTQQTLSSGADGATSTEQKSRTLPFEVPKMEQPTKVKDLAVSAELQQEVREAVRQATEADKSAKATKFAKSAKVKELQAPDWIRPRPSFSSCELVEADATEEPRQHQKRNNHPRKRRAHRGPAMLLCGTVVLVVVGVLGLLVLLVCDNLQLQAHNAALSQQVEQLQDDRLVRTIQSDSGSFTAVSQLSQAILAESGWNQEIIWLDADANTHTPLLCRRVELFGPLEESEPYYWSTGFFHTTIPILGAMVGETYYSAAENAAYADGEIHEIDALHVLHLGDCLYAAQLTYVRPDELADNYLTADGKIDYHSMNEQGVRLPVAYHDMVDYNENGPTYRPIISKENVLPASMWHN